MKTVAELNELAARVHKANEKWWVDIETGERIERNKGEQIMLMVSELSEAMEGARKDKMDDHLPHRKMEEVEIADFVIRLLDYVAGHGYVLHDSTGVLEAVPSGNVGEFLFMLVKGVVGLHDIEIGEILSFDPRRTIGEFCVYMLVGAESYANWRGLDLWGAFEEKMEYNARRHDHTIEARLAEGGKKW